jgi:hypothetical protein
MKALFLLVVLFVAQSGGGATATDILPADGFNGGWKRFGPARLFEKGDLYGHINGGAELFFEFGFNSLTVQYYRRDGVEFSVEVYRMTDSLAATGVYLMNRGKDAASAGFPERHSLNRFQLQFKRGPYYVLVHNLDGEETMIDEMLAFGRHMVSRLPPDEPEEIFKELPGEALDPDSLRLVRGPVALQSLYTLGEGDVLRLKGELTAVSGHYRSATGSYTLLIVDYPDRQSCLEAFSHLLGNLDGLLNRLKVAEDELVFRDWAGEQGRVVISDRRLELRIGLK